MPETHVHHTRWSTRHPHRGDGLPAGGDAVPPPVTPRSDLVTRDALLCQTSGPCSTAQPAAVLDPEVPVLTIEDLGVLREVVVGRRRARSQVTITPTYSGCPAMDAIRAGRREPRFAGRLRRRAVRPVLVARMDDGLDDRGRQGEAARVRHRPARATELGTGRWCGCRVRCPQCGSVLDPRAQPVRVDGLQVAVGLRRLHGALRPLQGALSDGRDSRRRRSARPVGRSSTPCRSATSRQLTDDAVCITFAVPPELADDYDFVQGQHLTLRTSARR